MDKLIVTVLLMIGGVVASLAIINGLYPAITQSTGAISGAAIKISDRIKTDIEIIQVVSDNTSTEVDIWVKNVGTTVVGGIEWSDVFYGLASNFGRVPYGSSGPPYPYWDYQLEGNNSAWKTAVTLKITIHLDSGPSAGDYMLKVVIPNGIYDETTFGIE